MSSVGTPYRFLNTSGSEFLGSRIYVRTFQAEAGSREFYVRIFEDRGTTDLLITLGPMSEQDADQLGSLLKRTHCHIEERNESPFERDLEEFEE